MFDWDDLKHLPPLAALGHAEPELRRVLGPIVERTRSGRILARPQLRRRPRVAAGFGFVVDETRRCARASLADRG